MNGRISAIDLFCGVGGLTYGLLQEKINVRVGVDIDPACRYPYEYNNDAVFLEKSVSDVTADDLSSFYPSDGVRLIAGCAPCQPFSNYSYRYNKTDDGLKNAKLVGDENGKWKLLNSFANIIGDLRPELVTMENVSLLANHDIFDEFVSSLKRLKYFVSVYPRVDCSLYGVAQKRIRLVLFASMYGEVELCRPFSKKSLNVRNVIAKLPKISAGGVCGLDALHKSRNLTDLNLRRIQASKPGGTWKDWDDELITPCHKAIGGKTYRSVYGRMSWEKPSPTITTEFYAYGSGRFGHPDQDRAISLREGALLQSFPRDYRFSEDSETISFSKIGRLIGNAVPVNLGRAIGRSLNEHINKYRPTGG
jgi:DNA (cytosine-5)-methyltransferase 1